MFLSADCMTRSTKIDTFQTSDLVLSKNFLLMWDLHNSATEILSDFCIILPSLDKSVGFMSDVCRSEGEGGITLH